MGNIAFADCQDARKQTRIEAVDCPHCHEKGGIEIFVKDGLTVEDSKCVSCGYILAAGTEPARIRRFGE